MISDKNAVKPINLPDLEFLMETEGRMKPKSIPVGARMCIKQIDAIRDLVDRKLFDTRAQFIRFAVRYTMKNIKELFESLEEEED